VIYHLNEIKESRGDLFIIESSANLNLDYSNYYIIDNTNFHISEGIKFCLLVIRGEIVLNNFSLKRGKMACVDIGNLIGASTGFVGLLITDIDLTLKSIEGINFNIQRIFFVDNMPIGSVRGQHAHSIETEFLYFVNGDFEVEIKDIGEFNGIISTGGSVVSLPNAWTSVKSLTKGGVLLAFLSHKYDANGFSKDR
jgi:hypothetical protein